MFGPSSPATNSAWAAYHERYQEVVPVVEVTLAQLDVAVAAPPDEAAAVVGTSYGSVGLVETWEGAEEHIVLGLLPPRHAAARVDTSQVPALGELIHAKGYFVRL
jgi:hypothetical protein